MTEKSKFVGFILSFIPGSAHLYIGLRERAVIFLGMLGGGFFASLIIGFITGADAIFPLFISGYFILWLVSTIDLFTSWNMAIEYSSENISGNPENTSVDNKGIKESNKKTISLALSIIPGAGHMYLGYEKKGLLIMGIFFFSIFFMGWLGLSFLLFLLPLIWFYSFFDTMHTVDGNKEQNKDQDFQLENIKPQWLGYGLIALGVVIIIERIIYPLIDYRIRNYIQTTTVSLIFIILGVYILNKNKKENYIDIEEDHNED